MVGLLYLGHGLLAATALAVHRSPARKQMVPVIAWTGVALGAVLFLFRHSGAHWRSTTIEPGPAAAAGLAAACAWLLVALFDHGEGHWERATLTGVASCGLTLFAVNNWIVPALLFWWASSFAIAVAVRSAAGRVHVWMTLAISDALLLAGLIAFALDTELWLLPPALDGSPFWLLVVATIVRASIVPRVGGWDKETAYLWPLLPGGAFALVTGIAGREQPWVGLVLLLASLGAVAWLLMRENFELSVAVVWPLALMLAVLFVVPGAPWQAAAAALIAGTSVLLWPIAEGRAQVERGLLLSFLPPSAGFSAIVAAAVASFDQATATSGVIAAAPWTAVTALLPAAVAGGVVLGARVGRRAEAEHYQPAGVIATWALFIALVLAGLWPRIAGTTALSSRVAWANVVAVGAGVAAARFGARSQLEVPAEPADSAALIVFPLPGNIAAVLQWGAAVIAAIALVAMLWLTVRGLQIGFL